MSFFFQMSSLCLSHVTICFHCQAAATPTLLSDGWFLLSPGLNRAFGERFCDLLSPVFHHCSSSTAFTLTAAAVGERRVDWQSP